MAVWNIATAQYDSISFFVAGQSFVSSALVFKTDGTKVYVLDDSDNTLYQYVLSVAWDLTTASFENKFFDLPNITGFQVVSGIRFKDDGTRVYVTGYGSGQAALRQYDLSTAWDITTAGLTANFNAGSFLSVSSINDIFFKDDGLKVYITSPSTVHQFDVVGAWDISTAVSNLITFSVGSQDNDPSGIFFRDNGEKLFVLGDSTNTVYQYTLTAWDISTLSYDSVSFSVNSQEVTPKGIAWKSDGFKFYIIGDNSNTIYQYKVDAPSTSPSASLSPSASASASRSPSASLSPSASSSPSRSPSSSLSASISPSSSLSPSASASISPSASLSPSASASISPSASLSPSASISPSSSVSLSLSPSASESISVSLSLSPSSSLSASVSPSVVFKGIIGGLLAKAIGSPVGNEFIIGGGEASTFSMNLVNFGTFVGDGGGSDTAITPIAVSGIENVPYNTTISAITWYLTRPLSTGEKVILQVYKNGLTTPTIYSTLDFSVDGAISSKRQVKTLKQINNFSIGIIWKMIDNNATAPAVLSAEVEVN